MIKYCICIKNICQEITLILPRLKEIDLDTLYTNTIYAIFVIVLSFFALKLIGLILRQIFLYEYNT
jgi:hypothetical protein